MEKLKKGKAVCSHGREIIMNVYRYLETESYNSEIPEKRISVITNKTADATGVSDRTVRRIKKEFEMQESFSTPGKKRKRESIITNIDDFDKSAIRNIIYNMYRNEEFPTVSTILKRAKNDFQFPGKRTSLLKIIKNLGFKWKSHSGRKFLLEKSHIIAKRRQYMKTIKANNQLQNPRPIVYLDETWIHTNYTKTKTWIDIKSKKPSGPEVPSSKGARFIIVHAGTKNGFVSGASLLFQANKKIGDYHDEMNSENFTKWFKNQLLPNIEPNSIIVMDNAPYHSVEINKAPNSNTKKADIQNWLKTNNIAFEENMLKAELSSLVKKYKPEKKNTLLTKLQQALVTESFAFPRIIVI